MVNISKKQHIKKTIILPLYMMGNYEIINSQVIFAYRRSVNIRKRQFEFEDKLNELFNSPFNSYAIADEIDGNIPRFEAASIHGFSKLQVSQFKTSLITNFKDEYKTDINKISSYLSDRINILKELLNTEKNTFAAFVIEIGYEFSNDDKLNELLKLNTGANCLNEKTNDFSISYSQEYNDDYFLNVKCSKYVESNFKIIDGELIPDGKEKKGISIILDINSKLAFNNGKESGVVIVDSLKEETFKILSEYTLEDYLKGNIK